MAFISEQILTSFSKVKEFLDKFEDLKVTNIEENDHAKPGGELFGCFKQKWDSLPEGQQITCLAFHGTADSNISNICQNGYDLKRRSRQVYGAGEYFTTSPDIAKSYCKGGKRMLLNELLLGENGKHHTMHNYDKIIVMKDPAHDLPRFVITFEN